MTAGPLPAAGAARWTGECSGPGAGGGSTADREPAAGGEPPAATTSALSTAYDGYAREYTKLLLGDRSEHLAETVALVRTLLAAGEAEEAGWPGPLNRLVDLACGPGLVSAELAADGWNVTGVDASWELVGIARARLPRVLHADATATGLPPGADAVVSTYTHTDVAAWPALVAEARRLLRPGGVLVYVGAHPAFVGPHIRRTPGRRWTAHVAAGYYHDPSPRFHGPGLTRGGLREHVGVRHLTIPTLLEPVLASGWREVRLVEDPADPPTLLGFRAVRDDR
jgi:SAM-dependent methyltransferase